MDGLFNTFNPVSVTLEDNLFNGVNVLVLRVHTVLHIYVMGNDFVSPWVNHIIKIQMSETVQM